MNKSKSFILLAVVAGVLILGVAYAAISDITLEITGTATSGGSSVDSNFNVEFTKGELDTENSKAGLTTTFDGTAGQTGKFTVSGLNEIGEKATIVFTVENKSADLEAILKSIVTTADGDTEYFTVTNAVLGADRLGVAGEADASTTVTLVVEVAKASVGEKTVTVGVTFDAEAADPQ